MSRDVCVVSVRRGWADGCEECGECGIQAAGHPGSTAEMPEDRVEGDPVMLGGGGVTAAGNTCSTAATPGLRADATTGRRLQTTRVPLSSRRIAPCASPTNWKRMMSASITLGRWYPLPTAEFCMAMVCFPTGVCKELIRQGGTPWMIALSLLALVSSTLLFATEGIPLRMPMAGISLRPLESV